MLPFLREEETQEALQVLRLGFYDPYGLVPRRVAEFLYRAPNDELQADVAGFIRDLLGKCDMA